MSPAAKRRFLNVVAIIASFCVVVTLFYLAFPTSPDQKRFKVRSSAYPYSHRLERGDADSGETMNFKCPGSSFWPNGTAKTFFARGRRDFCDHDPDSVICPALERMGLQRTKDQSEAEMLFLIVEDSRKMPPSPLPARAINHVLGLKSAVDHKDDLSSLEKACIAKYGNRCRFLPRHFAMPTERQEWLAFAKEHPSKFWVYKPAGGYSSKGIKFFKGPNANKVSKTEKATVQEYVMPMLWRGRKMDFRVLVVVTSINPLRLYTLPSCELVRVAGMKFNTKFDANECPHITSHFYKKCKKYLTKNLPEFTFEKGFLDGIKMTRAKWDSEVRPWMDLKMAVPLFAAYEQLMTAFNEQSPHDQKTIRRFAVVGYDLMVDKDAMAHVIEINTNAFLRYAPFKENAWQVPFRFLSLAGVAGYDCTPYRQEAEARINAFCLTLAAGCTKEDIKVLREFEDEEHAAKKHGFYRVFPSAHHSEYAAAFADVLSTHENVLLWEYLEHVNGF